MMTFSYLQPRRPDPERRAPKRPLGRSLAAVTSLVTSLLAGPTLAQPNKTDSPLRTQRGTTTKKADGAAGAKAGDGKIGTPADISFKGPPPGGRVNFNMREADLPDLVDAITAMTGRRFIFGGKLRSIKATVVSPGEVSAGEAYLAFLSVLEANGMTVVPHGRFLKIVESNGAPAELTPVLGTAEPVPYVDRFVTRMYRLRNVDANEVSSVLGKFKSKDGDITVYGPSNLLIITDTGANIRRMLRIVEELDAGGVGEQIWIQPINNMDATELATKLNELLDGGRSKIMPDERNNALVIVSTPDDYNRILELIKRIDVPIGGDGQIQVLPLQHAQCSELQATLGSIVTGSSAAPRTSTAGAAGARGRTGAARPTGGSTASQSGDGGGIFEGAVTLNCDEATNSLVTVSSLRDYAQLRNVIDRLDRPRRQVFIEAVIMDVNVDHNQQLGLGYHGGAPVGGDDPTFIYGGHNVAQSLTGLPASLEALAFGVRGPEIEGSQAFSPTGLSIPAFGIVLNALARSGDSNLLATPHVLATDNISAEITIGQNIPLQTNVGGSLGALAGLAGQAGGAGAGALAGLGGLGGLGGFNAPRQDVGIRLQITPHINDSDQVRMEISEEFSSAGAPLDGNLGAIPINKRTADTTIIVRDQQTVVIGGLTREEQINSATKIPVLGDIPVLGMLFRSTTKQKLKVNLLLILTPHIVRDQNDLRRIFERKMQERQEFLDRYFVFDDSLPWEPIQDYTRTNGMVEYIRQTQLKMADRERLNEELRPDAPKGHDQVEPIAMPSMAKPSSGGSTTPTPRPTTRPRTNPRTRTNSRTRVPGSRLRNTRYRVE